MKNRKLSKILGVGLSLMLALSLGLVFTAAPVAADDDEWGAFVIPLAGSGGDYFMDESVTTGGPIARDIDGTLWAATNIDDTQEAEGVVTTALAGGANTPIAEILTITYVNEDNVPARTGTATFTADAAPVGETQDIVLQAGDTGIHNITAITSVNDTTSGVISLRAAGSGHVLATYTITAANTGTFLAVDDIDAQILKSDDDGHTWEQTGWMNDVTVDVIDLVCSTLDADVVYALTAAEAFKTEDGGDSWAQIGDFAGAIVAGTFAATTPTCLAVGWDDDDNPRVFMGTSGARGYVAYMYDVPFGLDWADLTLDLAANTTVLNLDVWGISVSPDFSNDAFQAVLASDNVAGVTYLAWHVGSDPGNWSDVSLDDIEGDDIAATDGSDPVYPSDFNSDDFADEDTEIFVGVTAAYAGGNVHLLGGMFRIYGVDDGDEEMLGAGIVPATDVLDADICSLDIVGSLGDTQMVAGAGALAATAPDVWYSWDDGDSWESAAAEGINPAGAVNTDVEVVMDDDFDEDAGKAWCQSNGNDGGVHGTIDGGTSWQGYGLLDTDIDLIVAAAITDSDNMFLLTREVTTADEEVFRYASNWVRVYEDAQYALLTAADTIACVGETVVLADAGTTDMAFSIDNGQMFAEPDVEPGDNINALLMVDEDLWWIGDDDGDLYVSDDQGDRSWDIYGITNDAIISFDARGDLGLAGTADGEVWYTDDEGETWDQVDTATQAPGAAGMNVFVVFDSDSDTICYAASGTAGAEDIARFEDLTDLDLDWEAYTTAGGALDLEADGVASDFDAGTLTGIAMLNGVLYVSTNAVVNLTTTALDGGVARCVNPLANLDFIDWSDWDHLQAGLFETGDPFGGGIQVTSSSPNVVWGIDQSASTAGPPIVINGELWTYGDLMAEPVTGLECNPGSVDFTLGWVGFANATDYELSIFLNEDATAAYSFYELDTGNDNLAAVMDGVAPPAGEALIPTAGTQYWAWVRGSAPVHSKWSEVLTFNTNPGALAIDEDMLAPQLGALNVPTDTPFSWGFLAVADEYFIEISDTADFSNIIESATVTTPTYLMSTTLQADSNYWFRVYAISGGVMGDPAYSNFTTAAIPVVAPTPPAPAAPGPAITIPPVQEITPRWIYAIIAIGATLATVVIVLIVKVKRP